MDTISDKGVLNGCNILMKNNDMAFTGSAKSIADILKMETTKPSDVTGTDYERVGLIGYENKGTANILALSVEEDDNVAKQGRFRSESSSSSSSRRGGNWLQLSVERHYWWGSGERRRDHRRYQQRR